MTFHGWTHSLEDYSFALERAGFYIECLREPRPDLAASSYSRWRAAPLFLELPGDLAAERITAHLWPSNRARSSRGREPVDGESLRATNTLGVRTSAVLLVIVGLAAGCRNESTQSAAAPKVEPGRSAGVAVKSAPSTSTETQPKLRTCMSSRPRGVCRMGAGVFPTGGGPAHRTGVGRDGREPEGSQRVAVGVCIAEALHGSHLGISRRRTGSAN
jgi:hypothetical protein